MTKFDKFSQIINVVIIALSGFFIAVLGLSSVWIGVITWLCIGINSAMNYRVLSNLNKSNDGE